MVVGHQTVDVLALEHLVFEELLCEVLEREDIERIVGSYKGENGSSPEPADEPGPAKIAASERAN